MPDHVRMPRAVLPMVTAQRCEEGYRGVVEIAGVEVIVSTWDSTSPEAAMRYAEDKFARRLAELMQP